MAKTKVILALGTILAAAISWIWLGARWTISALEFGAVCTLLAYLFGASVPFGPGNAEEGLRLSYGAKEAGRIIQRVRRSYGLMPYISIFAVMTIAMLIGLFARLLGSVIIAIVVVAAAFFLYVLVIGVIRALRPPRDA